MPNLINQDCRIYREEISALRRGEAPAMAADELAAHAG
jgi:hypothetical protein